MKPMAPMLAVVLVLTVLMVVLSGLPLVRAAPPAIATTAAAPPGHWKTNPTVSPPTARQMYGMAYDSLLGELVMFGGEDQHNVPLGDTWVSADGNWSPAATAIAPSPRFAVGLAFDPALGGVVLFGGQGPSGFFNDTWLFNASGWHELAPSHSPPQTYSTNLVYDSSSDVLLLLTNLPHTHDQIFWEFAAKTWTNLTDTKVQPPAVWGNLADDPSAHGVLFYGGSNGCGNPEGGLALTWTYADGAWSNVTSNQSLTPVNAIGSLAMGFDPTRNGVVMFSGYTFGCLATNTTYLFTDGQWTNVTGSVGPPPPPRFNARLVYLPRMGDVMFSGNEAPTGGVNEFGDDTWFLQAGTFVAGVTPSFTTSIASSTVTFRDDSTPRADGIVLIAWAFGDGHTATGSEANHTYSAIGSYEVYENVTDSYYTVFSTHRNVTIAAVTNGTNPGGGPIPGGNGPTSSTDWNGLWVWVAVAGGAAAVGLLSVLRWRPDLLRRSGKP
jgi:PKD domain